jgi:hypothetical protein
MSNEIGPMDPTSSPLRGEEFVKDWNRMIATVAEFSDKWNLPKAEMTFHPKVHVTMNLVARDRILGTLIHMGVKVRFGFFVQGTIFKEA